MPVSDQDRGIIPKTTWVQIKDRGHHHDTF